MMLLCGCTRDAVTLCQEHAVIDTEAPQRIAAGNHGVYDAIKLDNGWAIRMTPFDTHYAPMHSVTRYDSAPAAHRAWQLETVTYQ